MAQLPPKKSDEMGKMGYRTDLRVSYVLREQDNLVQCPYDSSHYVMEPRFVQHLRKCRHNYLNQRSKNEKAADEIVICPYEFIHHVRRSELDEHEKTCTGRRDDDDFPFPSGPSKTEEDVKPFIALTEDVKPFLATAQGQGLEPSVGITEDEKPTFATTDPPCFDDSNWEPFEQKPEQEATLKRRYNRYNPEVVVRTQKPTIITNPQGLTKSEKKEQRQKQRDEMLVEEDEEEQDELHARYVSQRREVDPQVGYPGYDISVDYNDDVLTACRDYPF